MNGCSASAVGLENLPETSASQSIDVQKRPRKGPGWCHMRICEADLDRVPVRWFVQCDGISDSAELQQD